MKRYGLLSSYHFCKYYCPDLFYFLKTIDQNWLFSTLTYLSNFSASPKPNGWTGILGKYDTSSIGLWYSPSEWNTIGIIHRQGIWFEHLTFCLMLASSRYCNFAWSKVSRMVWHKLSNCKVVTSSWPPSNFFFLRTKKFWHYWKDNLILINSEESIYG